MTTAMAKQGQSADGAGEQRSALLRRVGVAGLMIALLIGGLALFDASRKAPDDEGDDEVDAPAAVRTETATPPAMPEPPAEATPASIEESPPALPDVEPAAAEAASTSAEAPTPAAAVPASPAHAPATPPAAAPVPRPAVPAARAAAVPESTSRPEDTVSPGPAAAPPAIARTPATASGGYLVQAGVFSNAANAEELRARLALHGIPAQIESRVQVGPFRTRAEADSARSRMRALGLDSGPPTAVGTGSR